MTEFLPLIIAAVMVISFVLGRKWLINRMNMNYNYRQQLIYERACQIIFRKASETDTSREDTMILLNAAMEVYNESLRGKHATFLQAEPFRIMNQSNEMGKPFSTSQIDSKKENEAEVIENDG